MKNPIQRKKFTEPNVQLNQILNDEIEKHEFKKEKNNNKWTWVILLNLS